MPDAAAAITTRKTRRFAPAGFSSLLGADRLEAERHLADQGARRACGVVDHGALAPGVFKTDIDKRHRIPDQVGMSRDHFLVQCVASGRTDQLERDAVLRVEASVDV